MTRLTPCRWKGWGPPGALVAVIGNESSIVLFDGREYTLPLGSRSAAAWVPLKI